MLASILLSLLGVMLLGVLLIVLGVRGKRLNSHPTCRWCGFDLENIYPASVTCPECGAGLKREKAVRIGQRRRRPVFILAGVLLVLTPLAPIGATLFAAITGTDVNRYKPLGLLLWELDRVDAKKSAAIASELLARLQASKVDVAQEQRILSYTLDRQADPARAWSKEWSDIVDRVRLNGRLSKSDEKRFLLQSVVPKLIPRPRVTAGEVLPIGIDHELRAGGDQAMASLWLEKATINGVKLLRTFPEPGSENGFWGAFAMTDTLPLAQVWIMPSTAGWSFGQSEETVAAFRAKADLPPGPATIELELLVAVEKWDMTGRNISFASGKPPPSSPDVRRITLTAPVEILAKGVPDVEKVASSEALSIELAKKLRPSQLTVSPGGLGSAGMVQAEIGVGDLPVPVIFDVFARSPDYREGAGKEHRLGTISSGKGEFDAMRMSGWSAQSSTRSIWANVRLPKGNKVDLVFRPRTDLASRTLDITRVYDGEVIVRGVDVNRIDARTVYNNVQVTTDDAETSSPEDAEPAQEKDPEKPKSSGSNPWKKLLSWP